ncbi:hypothetical protein WA538_003048 [Blastocystis sp. DL]
MEGDRPAMDTNEASALLEWVNSCPCIHIVYHTFMELKDGIALSTILNDIDPLEFELNPRTDTTDNSAACRQNLEAIIQAIVVYYNRTKGWILESNISLDDLFVLQKEEPLILIIRWVITTILFSMKRTVYIQTIMSLSLPTQSHLQRIIEAVMNTFPPDDETESVVSDVHSILEESQHHLSAVWDRSIPIDSDSLSVAPARDAELRELEHRVLSLQQSLAGSREETELLRRQRDELQSEVTRLEAQLATQKRLISGLEGEGRRMSSQLDDTRVKLTEDNRQLREENEQLQRKIEVFSTENEQTTREVAFLRTEKEEVAQRHQQAVADYESELKKLHGEIAMLTSEREVLVKASQKAELLKQRVESLRSVETQLSTLREENQSLKQKLETSKTTAADDGIALSEVKRLREEVGNLRGKLDAMTMEKELLQKQGESAKTENRRLEEELRQMKRRWDSVPTGDSAPAGDSAPTVSLVLEDESALKKKVAQYIVENSELRRQMQQQQRMHDEMLQGKEEEYAARKRSLEEAFAQRLQEADQLKEEVAKKETELGEQKSVIADLREVVATQESEKKESGDKLRRLDDRVKELEETLKAKEAQYGELKRKCDTYEAKEADDRKKRKELDTEKRIIVREREVMRNTLFRKGNDIFTKAGTNALQNSRSAQFLRKSQQYTK